MRSLIRSVLKFGSVLAFVLLALASSAFAAGLSRSVSKSSDDGHQITTDNWSVSTDDTYIEFRDDWNRWGGAVRFPDITIPPNSTINSAYFVISVIQPFNQPECSVAAEDVANPDTLEEANPSTQIKDKWDAGHTSAVYWTGTLCTPGPGCRDSIAVTTAIQQIVNRGDWVSGNAIMIIGTVETDSYFEIYTQDHASTSLHPVLNIDYTPPPAVIIPMRIKDDQRFATSFFDWRFQSPAKKGILKILDEDGIVTILDAQEGIVKILR